MKNPKPVQGKILLHGNGTGGVTESDVTRRARELAAIAGRSSSAVTEEDLVRARKELKGENLPPTTGEDDSADIALTRDPSEPPSETGHQVVEQELPDDEMETERLIEEGVEEAQHEQMLAASRLARKQDKRG